MGFTSYGTLGQAPWTAPQPVLQSLQIMPQQLQQLQQAAYIQLQQVQQVQQLLQILPQQIQQLQQSIQFLPHYVAQFVQQALGQSSIGAPASGFASIGTVPFGGLSTSQPLQSPVFGIPFQSIQPAVNTPFQAGQPGYVM
jgi:hypothetical protein